MIRCNPEVNKNCHSDEQTNEFFKSIYFTQYYIEEIVDFSNYENIGHRPVHKSDSF